MIDLVMFKRKIKSINTIFFSWLVYCWNCICWCEPFISITFSLFRNAITHYLSVYIIHAFICWIFENNHFFSHQSVLEDWNRNLTSMYLFVWFFFHLVSTNFYTLCISASLIFSFQFKEDPSDQNILITVTIQYI